MSWVILSTDKSHCENIDQQINMLKAKLNSKNEPDLQEWYHRILFILKWIERWHNHDNIENCYQKIEFVIFYKIQNYRDR